MSWLVLTELPGAAADLCVRAAMTWPTWPGGPYHQGSKNRGWLPGVLSAVVSGRRLCSLAAGTPSGLQQLPRGGVITGPPLFGNKAHLLLSLGCTHPPPGQDRSASPGQASPALLCRAGHPPVLREAGSCPRLYMGRVTHGVCGMWDRHPRTPEGTGPPGLAPALREGQEGQAKEAQALQAEGTAPAEAQMPSSDWSGGACGLGGSGQ